MPHLVKTNKVTAEIANTKPDAMLKLYKDGTG